MTRVPEGRLCFLRPGTHDIYETIKACLAVPGCYPCTVSIGESEYVDGGTVNPLPVKGLFDERNDRVVVIMSKPIDCEAEPPSLLERSLFWRYFQKYDWMLEKLWEAAQSYNEQVFYLERLAQENPSRAFIICPDKMPPARFISRDKKRINKTIDLGYRKVEEREQEIRRFLFEAPEAG